MTTYKPDQGRLARMFAFWSLVFIVLFGCHFLYVQLVSNVVSLRPALGGIVLPIVGVAVNGAFLIAASLAALGVFLIYRWQQRPQVGDFLIDTEGELRKVTWPTMPEVINSSIVVIVCVLFLMGFLAFADWFFGRLFQRLFLA